MCIYSSTQCSEKYWHECSLFEGIHAMCGVVVYLQVHPVLPIAVAL